MNRTEATELALELANNYGLVVFPIAISWDEKKQGTTKRPLTHHGHNSGSNEEPAIRYLFESAHLREGDEFGVGVLPGSAGYVVLDVDKKNGKDGFVSLNAIFEDENSQFQGKTAVISTASSGVHIWCKKLDQNQRIGSADLADGINVRADDGWVVAPGVTCEWGDWQFIEGSAQLDDTCVAPSGIWNRLTHATQHLKGTGQFDREALSQPDREMLELLESIGGHTPYAKYDSEGELFCINIHRPGKHSSSSASIGQISPGVVKIFTDNWELPNGNVLPAMSVWNASELRAILKKDETRPKKQLKDYLVPAWELEETEPPKWLIKEHLVEDSIAALWSPPNIGKSFLALDWAYHIAAGKEWHGKEVTQANVLYVVAEGGKQFGRRIRAWHHYFEMGDPKDAKLPLYIIGTATNLSNDAIVTDIIELAQSVDARMIVFDTLARCNDVDENDNTRQGDIVRNVEEIKNATQATVLLVAHPGKQRPDEIRGASAWEGALETGFYLEAGKGDDATFTLHNKKQKDFPKIKKQEFVREVVEYGEGEYDNSCIVRPIKQTITIGTKDKRPEATPVQKAAYALSKVQIQNGVTTGVWKEATGVTVQGTWNRYKTLCMEQGLVVCVSGDPSNHRTARWRVSSEFEAMIPELFGEE